MNEIKGIGYTLICGDCLDVMAEIPDNHIDLTVTSPPYDNLRDYGKDFNADSFDWKPIIKELYRVTADGGVVVWVVADATINGSETGTSFRQALWAMKCGFNNKTMFFESDKPPQNQRWYEPKVEYMFIWSKSKTKTFNPIMEPSTYGEMKCKPHNVGKNGERQKWTGNGIVKKMKLKSNVWYFSTGKNKTTTDDIPGKHPAMFPEALANDHIISWSNPGDLVFDPFLGSGTTGKRAIKNGRNFIGCDIEEDYINIARQRIANIAGDYVTTDKEKVAGQIALWDLM